MLPRMRHMSGPVKDLAPHAKTPCLSLVGVELHGRGRRDAVGGTVDVDAEGLVHAGRVVVCARPQVPDVIIGLALTLASVVSQVSQTFEQVSFRS